LNSSVDRLDFVNSESALDECYRQAVEVSEELEWAVPSRAEFEEQYKREIEKLRRHE